MPNTTKSVRIMMVAILSVALWITGLSLGISYGDWRGRRVIQAEAIRAGVAEHDGVDENDNPVFKWKVLEKAHETD